jgi:circadian clock protein KaiC
MREYEITSRGIVVGDRLRGYWGLTSGIPGPWSNSDGQRAQPEEPGGKRRR